MSERILDGAGVLITRPRHQARQLASAIESQGGIAHLFPVIEILPGKTAEIEGEVADLQTPDITVFVSRNAVRHGLRYAAGKIASIGPATTAALRTAGSAVDIFSGAGIDSEHLLAEAAFDDVADKTIRIIRGESGRDLLASTLKERGAHVDYVCTYSRATPEYSGSELASLEQLWRNGEISAVTVLSVHSLRNLIALLPDSCREQMSLTPLVTPAARVLQEALQQYPDCPAVLATRPRSDDMVNAVAAAIEISATRPLPGTS